MKFGIELNGVANLKLLFQQIREDFGHEAPDLGTYDCFPSAEEQLDLLERYMIAYCKAVNAGVQPPYWHDIKAEPTKYPLNRDL